MLSTLSSLLPSALVDKFDRLESQESGDNGQQDETRVTRRNVADDPKKEKKKKSSNETFIVVRPPPAKSNHPLNLQLQLVPAHHSRDRSNTSTVAATTTNSRFSTDSHRDIETVSSAGQSSSSPSHSETAQGLHRTPSTRSTRSDTSTFYASGAFAGSVTSFASTASTSSARRMIIPLYNLSAHNVMTNTVLDAGTDAKVAKFGKRSLEIIGLAVLEPTEVWAGKDHAHGAGVGAASEPLGVPIHRSTSGQSSLAPPGQNGSRAGTPDPSHSPGSSRLSMSSDHSSSVSHSPQPSHDPAKTSAAQPTGARKLFGKMFRKKEGISAVPTPPRPPPAAPSPPKVLLPLPEARPPTSARGSADVLLPAVLGLQPTLSAATNPPSGRCVSYVWVVRKWLKVENQGLISGTLAKLGREASAHGLGHIGAPEASEWEIRFEWSRGNSKEKKARRATRRPSMDVGGKTDSRTPSRRQSAVLGPDDLSPSQRTSNGVAISIDSPRQSLDVPANPTPRAQSPRQDRDARVVSVASTSPSDDDAAAGGQQEDQGDESDPEDSETPWTCALILTHPSRPVASTFSKGHSRTRTVSSSGAGAILDYRPRAANHKSSASESGLGLPPPPEPTKLKVATLAPAPHHPKVVCQLKIPFPLPDVEVDRGVLRKRLVLADGSTRSTVPADRGPGAQPSIMTAEEIKDVVCSTAFWVIVREGFGGLGKKNRKGDGWKIRG